MGERAPERDRAVVLVLVVLRRPHLIVELPGRRRVVDDRRRRDVGAPVVGRLLERGEVDERLEHRSRLAARRRSRGCTATGCTSGRRPTRGSRRCADRRRSAPLRRLPLRLRRDSSLSTLRQARRARRPARAAAGADRASCRRRPAWSVVVVRPGILLGRASGRRSRRSTAPRLRARAARRSAAPARRASAASCGDEPGVGHRLQHDVAALRQRSGLLNGESADGDWMTPAIVAASASETLLTSLPKNSRAASGDADDARTSRAGRAARRSDTSRGSRPSRRAASRTTRDPDLEQPCAAAIARAPSAASMPSNFGRNTLRTSCWVIVLRRPRYGAACRCRFETTAPAMPIGSTPGWS